MAIESTNFFSFLQQTRSPIGLVDQYNLSEIYDSDQRDALENLLLNPDGLDEIYNLSKGEPPVIKEDIRLIGGLKSPVIESLGLFDEVRPSISYDLSTQVRVGADIGEPGKQSYISPSQSDNVIVYQGGLAAKNIEYTYLDLDGEVKTTSVSTSRESLFNSQMNDDGNFTSASYPGLIRIRRRGHFNQIKLNAKLFVTKGAITETPNAIMKIPTFMRTNANTSPNVSTLEAYATKNSPLEIPIKVLGTGSFNLGTVTPQNEAYFFGFEIKRKSDNAVVMTRVYEGNGVAQKPVDLGDNGQTFNLSGTIGDNQDCILSIYCAPSLIKMIDLSGLNIRENAGKDIGLIGFDNLEEVYLSNNDLKNIPTWLKVNYKTLKVLNLKNNSFWNNGPVEFFDHQDSIGKDGSNGGGAPLLSGTQILSYSGHRDSSSTAAGVDTNGKIEFYEGLLSTVVDGSEAKNSTTDATKFIKGRARDVAGSSSIDIDSDGSTGFRVFSALETLQIGSSFRTRNADFSKIFPNLLNIDFRRTGDGGERCQGSLPRINNNGNTAGISYNMHHQDNCGGNMRWVGSVPLFKNAPTGTATAGSFVTGATYVIATVGTTDFTAIGASANTVGVRFVATGAGSGTGTATLDQAQFIGQFKMKAWDTLRCGLFSGSSIMSGGICTDNGMITAGKVADVNQDGLKKYSLADGGVNGAAALAWSEWLASLETINLWRNECAFNIAEGNKTLNWDRLRSIQISYSGSYGTRQKVKYNQTKDGTNPYPTTAASSNGTTDLDAYDILYADSLQRIDAWSSGSGGRIFSIKDAESLTTLEVGYTNWRGYLDDDGSKYVLPRNFVDRDQKTNLAEQHPLRRFSIHYLQGGSAEELQFRADEFRDMSNVNSFEIRESYFWGEFPAFCNESQTTETINTWLNANRFYDLSQLGTDKNNRFGTIWAPNQGISRGGAIIPNFETSNPNSKLYNVQFYNSLFSNYDASWNVSSKAATRVFSALHGVPGVPTSQGSNDPVAWGSVAAERNGIPGSVTFTARNRAKVAASSRILFASDSNALLLKYVRVGDDIYGAASGGSPIGRVHQVKNGPDAYIVVEENKGWSNKPLYFQRAGIQVANYWNDCTNLRWLYFQNCSMVGRIPEFEGNSGKMERVRFQNNLFTTYVPGTLANLSGQAVGKTNRPRLRELNLSYNPLSLTSIRDIIDDAHSMAVFHNNNFYTITIDLRNTKANISEGTFSNYTLDEIFYNGTSGNSGSTPPVLPTPDPLLSKFNQLGSGNLYSKINIKLN